MKTLNELIDEQLEYYSDDGIAPDNNEELDIYTKLEQLELSTYNLAITIRQIIDEIEELENTKMPMNKLLGFKICLEAILKEIE